MHSLVLYTQQTRTKKIRKHKSCYGLVACYNTRPENNIGLFEDPETTGGTDYDENCTEECMRYPSDKQKEFKMVQCRLTCFSIQNVGPRPLEQFQPEALSGTISDLHCKTGSILLGYLSVSYKKVVRCNDYMRAEKIASIYKILRMFSVR